MNRRSLKLVNIEGIRVGDTLITSETLAQFNEARKGTALLPGIGDRWFNASNEQLLKILAYEDMPFTLTADAPLVLKAELQRYPYSINGSRKYQMFSCRLMPVSGRIARLEMHKYHSLAVNTQVVIPQGIMMNLGNGTLYLEMFYEPQDPRDLGPLKPPDGYRSEFFYDPADAID